MLFAVATMCVVACNSSRRLSTVSSHAAKSMVEEWPEMPKQAANMLIDKYGQPDEITDMVVVWRDKGPFREIKLSREEIPHDFPMPHTDFLQQTINYKVPLGKYDDLARYDGSIIVERTKGIMSARCDKEELNFLALNLAHDVVTGKRTVEQARDYYAKTAMKFKQGGTDPYLQGLQFDVQSGMTNDRDKPANMK